MTPAPHLHLSSLTVTDGQRPPAEITFAPGLNVIVGASDTGKTFIFDAIEYVLGASKPLRRVPESDGYVDVSLALERSAAPPVTLRRAFSGGQVVATEFANGRTMPRTAVKVLTIKRTKARGDNSLSSYLLRSIAFDGRRIRKNASGETEPLSFRHLCRLVLIGEERIIQKSSPVLRGQLIHETVDENVFALMLTGTDDGTIVAIERKEDRKARLVAQSELVTTLLNDKRAELAALVANSVDLSQEGNRLDSAIDEATRRVIASQAEIQQYERQRGELVSRRALRQSRRTFVQEQLSRLHLLQDYYHTDHARLETLLLASRVFHTLPEGACPFCNRPYDASSEPVGHADFEAACSAEMRKVEALSRDLSLAIADVATELSGLDKELSSIEQALGALEGELQRVLTPSATAVEGDLQALVQSRTTLAQALALDSTVRELERRLAELTDEREAAVPRERFPHRATTSAASAFCAVVEELLTAWQYPNLGRVTFDSENLDLVIGGQERATKGKGYRAVTYAAFAIGLMKYCRRNGIPHPGLVVLDTPLNPFKGPATGEGDRLGDAVKLAFFRHLADQPSDEQIVIMENEEPPVDVRDRITYHRFTKNADVERYGFFPR